MRRLLAAAAVAAHVAAALPTPPSMQPSGFVGAPPRGRKAALQQRFRGGAAHPAIADATQCPADDEHCLAAGEVVYAGTAEHEDAPKANSLADIVRFAVPALGIFVADPLLTIVDSAIVGRTVGPAALAALNPATTLCGFCVFVFSFLPRATTGLVARRSSHEQARAAVALPLNVALLCGTALLALLGVANRPLLKLLTATASRAALLPQASAYVAVRALGMPAQLMTSVTVASLLATREVKAPLVAVLSAALCNLVADTLLCVWPLRLGVEGAAAATVVSAYLGLGLLLRALAKRDLLPRASEVFSLPTWAKTAPLLEYAGPLTVVTAMRLFGFAAMVRTVSKMGPVAVAGYQCVVSLFIFFTLFAEPLSQAAQALLPPLLPVRRSGAAGAAAGAPAPAPAPVLFKRLVGLAGVTGAVVTVLTSLALARARAFTTDAAVLAQIQAMAPPMLIATMLACVNTVVDGSLLALKDFKFLTTISTVTALLQLPALAVVAASGLGAPAVFATFALRLAVFGLAGAARLRYSAGLL